MSKQRVVKELTSVQRMLKAMAFLKPDRVPVLFFPEFDLMADLAEKYGRYKTKKILVDPLEKV